jgi:hypothetical protein
MRDGALPADYGLFQFHTGADADVFSQPDPITQKSIGSYIAVCGNDGWSLYNGLRMNLCRVVYGYLIIDDVVMIQ